MRTGLEARSFTPGSRGTSRRQKRRLFLVLGNKDDLANLGTRGNGDTECRSGSAGSHAAAHPDSALMTVHDFIDQGQPDAGPAITFGSEVWLKIEW